VPRWSKSKTQAGRPINARAETLETRPVFRDAFAQRRCVVAADGFFEWAKTDGGRVPYWFRPSQGRLLYMAGLWDHWVDDATKEKMCSFSIVTTDANEDVEALHDRMPLILKADQIDAWIEGDRETAKSLLKPSPAGTLERTRVSSRVNSVKNDDPACLLEGEEADVAPKPARRSKAKKQAEVLSLFGAEPETGAKAPRH